MSGSRFFHMLFIRRHGIVSGRGLLFPSFSRDLPNDVFQTMSFSPSEKVQLARANSEAPQGEAGGTPDLNMTSYDKPLPLRTVLTRPIVVSVANYGMLALLTAVVEAYTPLVWSTPVEYGGLNLSPASIGLWLSLYGGMNGIVTLMFFPQFVDRFGPRLVYVFSLVSCAVIYTLFPFENLAVLVGGGPNIIVWLLMFLQMSSLCIFDMGYSRFYLYTYCLNADTYGTFTCRRNVYVHFICCSQQTVARRCVWSCTGGILGTERSWAGCCRAAIFLLLDA